MWHRSLARVPVTEIPISRPEKGQTHARRFSPGPVPARYTYTTLESLCREDPQSTHPGLKDDHLAPISSSPCGLLRPAQYPLSLSALAPLPIPVRCDGS